MRILSSEVVLEPIDSLHQHPQNPNRGDVATIASLIEANGFVGALVAQRTTGRILIGNHRWKAARSIGATEVPVFWVDVSDEEALRILLADNRASELRSNDPRELIALLESLQVTATGLTGTAYNATDVLTLLAELGNDAILPPADTPTDALDDVEAAAVSRVTGILAAAHVTIDDPQHKVAPGQCWEVGPHRLFCCSVFRDWMTYLPSLQPGMIFLPFPGPFVPLVQRLESTPLVMVQPNPYICGHLLDRMQEQHPDWTIRTTAHT